MPAATKKTPPTIKKLIALHEKGASAREIGEELNIEHATVGKWLRDMGLEPNGGHGRRKSRRRAKPSKDDETAAKTAAAIQADLASGFTGIDVLRQRLASLRKAVKEADAAFLKGHLSGTQYEKLIALEAKIARELAEAEVATNEKTGPSPTDPFTADAAARVTAKLQKLIEKAERRRSA
jgi:transposase